MGSLYRGALYIYYLMEFFIDIILPAALWALGSTPSLTEMSTSSISGGVKVAGA